MLGNTEDAMESGNVYTKQQRIAQLAELHPQLSFTSLAYHVDLEWLKEAYRRTRKSAAAGVDGVTAQEYEQDLEGNLRRLLERFKSGAVRSAAGAAGVHPEGRWQAGAADRDTDA